MVALVHVLFVLMSLLHEATGRALVSLTSKAYSPIPSMPIKETTNSKKQRKQMRSVRPHGEKRKCRNPVTQDFHHHCHHHHVWGTDMRFKFEMK